MDQILSDIVLAGFFFSVILSQFSIAVKLDSTSEISFIFCALD